MRRLGGTADVRVVLQSLPGHECTVIDTSRSSGVHGRIAAILAVADRGDVAQLAEHLLCKQGVVGSIPIVSTDKVPGSKATGGFLVDEERPGVPLSC